MKPRTNAEWLEDLRSQGEAQNAAIADLRSFLLRAAFYSLYRSRNNLANVERGAVEQLAEDTAQEALLAILKHLEEFRSESRFTTWAYKFAINFALVAARRERWKNVSLDDLLDHALPDAFRDDGAAAEPERAAEQAEAWTIIREIMDHELSDRQRQVMEAIVFEDVPLDEVAHHWGSNRNATYKLLHDARRKLKTGLQARGFELQDLLNLFRART
ncbi:MAG: RNA polymerase sigma factor [Acidobacteriota bacterium]